MRRCTIMDSRKIGHIRNRAIFLAIIVYFAKVRQISIQDSNILESFTTVESLENLLLT